MKLAALQTIPLATLSERSISTGRSAPHAQTVPQCRTTVSEKREQAGPPNAFTSGDAPRASSTLRDHTDGATLVKLQLLARSLRRFEPESSEGPANAAAPDFADLRGDALRSAIRTLTSEHRVIGYNEARRIIFATLDNRNGFVTDVYAGRRVRAHGIPKLDNINVEHVWPQDNGIASTRAVTDLHNLLPTDREANLKRGSLPFGEVETVLVQFGESKLGSDRTGRLVWEPPTELKGRIARIMCYVAATYDQPIAAQDADTFSRWNRDYMVSDVERQRDADIAGIQGKPNPFVTQPELVDRMLDVAV